MDDPPSTKLSILDLALELRLKIYRHIFHKLEYSCRVKKVQLGQIHHFCGPLGTLHSCRQIRAEALPIFRRNLSLHFWTPSSSSSSSTKRSGENGDCPPVIFANATRLIDPDLDWRHLREQIAQWPPRVTFISISGAALYLDSHELVSGDGHDAHHLAARLRGDDDRVSLRKALALPEYLDLQTSPVCNAAGENVAMHFVHAVMWPNASLYHVYYLKIDPFSHAVVERLIRFGVRDVPAKDVLLLTEGLSYPALYCLSERCFRYLAYSEDTLAKVKMELAKQETFDKAWECAKRCG